MTSHSFTEQDLGGRGQSLPQGLCASLGYLLHVPELFYTRENPPPNGRC